MEKGGFKKVLRGSVLTVTIGAVALAGCKTDTGTGALVGGGGNWS